MYYRPTVHVDGEVTVQTLDWYIHDVATSPDWYIYDVATSPYSKQYITENGWLTSKQYRDWCDVRALVAKANQEAGVNTDF